MATEQIEILARSLYGFQLTVHSILSDMPLGLSFAGLCLSVYNFLNGKIAKDIRQKFLDLFSISWILAGLSALIYELEYRHNWLGMDNILMEFYKYPWLTDIPVLSFFVTGGALAIIYKKRSWETNRGFLVLSIVLFICIMATNLWAITLNSLMMVPDGLSFNQHYLVLDRNISSYILSNYNLARLCHVLGAVTVKSTIFLGILLALDKKKSLPSYVLYHKTLLIISLSCIFLCAASGHLKTSTLAEKRTHTFLLMEGIKDSSDKANLCLFCLPRKNGSAVGISINNGIRHLLPSKIYNKLDNFINSSTEDKSSGIIFFTYHIMIWGWFILVALSCIALYKRIPSLILQLSMFFIAFVSILCGWYLAELSRQPWAFWGLVKVADLLNPELSLEHLHLSIIFTIINTLILFTISVFGAIMLIKPLRQEIGDEKI